LGIISFTTSVRQPYAKRFSFQLGIVDNFRIFDWVGEIKYFELVWEKSKKPLQD